MYLSVYALLCLPVLGENRICVGTSRRKLSSSYLRKVQRSFKKACTIGDVREGVLTDTSSPVQTRGKKDK